MQYQEYNAAIAADNRLQTLLEQQYGDRAVDYRYDRQLQERWPPEIQTAYQEKVRADAAYHQKIDESRKTAPA